MIVSVPYYRGSDFKYFNEDNVQEWIIKFNRDDSTLPDFLRTYASFTKHIVIYYEYPESEILQNEDIKLWIALFEKYPYFSIRTSYNDSEIVKQLKENKIPFFFREPAATYAILQGMIAEGVCDVYVTDELGFSLPNVKKICAKAGVRVRVYPNVAQSVWQQTPAYRQFFIRPEDIKLYEKYIDVIEFYKTEQPNRYFNMWYDAYFIKGYWFGQLNDLILDFNTPVDNRCILTLFGVSRIKCNYRCGEGKCKICDSIIDASSTLQDKKIYIKPKEKNT